MTKTKPSLMTPLYLVAVVLLATSGPVAHAAPGRGFTPPPVLRPMAVPTPPRPMPTFNISAIRQPAPVVPAPTAASKPPPNLSRSFYVARDGLPRNGGFAQGTGHVTTLKPGAIIGRKGDGNGRYATQTWAPKAGSLGLDPKADRQPMRYYRVTRPVEAVSGKTAPAWSAPGGGNQLVLPNKVAALQRNGTLQRTAIPNFRMSAGRR